jgi:hypothetical protein
MSWIKRQGCAHYVEAEQCVICHPGIVVVVAICSGCRSKRSMSIPATPGTFVAHDVTYICAICARRGIAEVAA